jgi:hypothetical protein
MNRLAVMATLMFVSVWLSGCSEYIARNMKMGEPTRWPDEKWVKEGTTRLDIRKALLECGDVSTQPDRFVYEMVMGIRDIDAILNHQLLVGGCMEKSGFVEKAGRGGRSPTLADYCTVYQDRHLPACQPGAVIPERSVERRLNSWYCKVKTDREYCRKHAFNPAACDDPKKDYNNPPPECRP